MNNPTLRTVGLIAFTIAYWVAAIPLIFTALLGTCGMGPDATCANGGMLSFLFAVIGFTAIFISIIIFFLKKKNPNGA